MTDGSLSSCPPAEAVTWGKVDKDTYQQTTESMQADYSMVMPFLVKALLDNRARYAAMAEARGRGGVISPGTEGARISAPARGIPAIQTSGKSCRSGCWTTCATTESGCSKACAGDFSSPLLQLPYSFSILVERHQTVLADLQHTAKL